MSSRQKTFTVIEVSQSVGLGHEQIITWIERDWVSPCVADHEKLAQAQLDEEDVARIRLIHELQQDLGANDESVPVILHLMDQLYFLREQVKRLGGKKG